MAVIDKLHTAQWYEYKDLVTWVMLYNSKMLCNIYDIAISEIEWYDRQKEVFEGQREIITREYDDNETIEQYIFRMEAKGILGTRDEFREDFDYLAKKYRYYQNEENICAVQLPIANFRLRQDRYLLWHCPLGFIRDYLEVQCGYKTRWYHKIFWKGNKYFK